MKNLNPFVSILIIIGLFVIGIFIGKSKWFNDLLVKVLPTPSPTPNGTVCTMPDGSAGKINGGVCVKDIGIPDTTASLRTLGGRRAQVQANGGEVGRFPASCEKWILCTPSDPDCPRYWLECVEDLKTTHRTTNANAPSTLLVLSNTPMPYKYAGCTYGKPYPHPQRFGYVVITKLSCP